jgi:hypothetical protein
MNNQEFKQDWFSLPLPILTQKYNMSRSHLRKKASFLKAYRPSLDILLNDSILSWYWLGFIMSDGTISNSGNLRVRIAEKDKIHLIKLGEYLQVDIGDVNPSGYGKIINSKACGLSSKDRIYGPKILELFKTTSNKTKYGISFDPINTTNLIPFLCGLIDGDGTFVLQRKKLSSIRIQCHISWKDFYISVSNMLKSIFNIESYIYLDSAGYCQLIINKHYNLIHFNKIVSTFRLPLLERKWLRMNTLLNID